MGIEMVYPHWCVWMMCQWVEWDSVQSASTHLHCVCVWNMTMKMTIHVECVFDLCKKHAHNTSLSNLPQGIGDSGQGFVNALLFCLFTTKVREKFKTEVMRLYHCCRCRRHPYTNLDYSTNASLPDSQAKRKKLPLSENAWVFIFVLCYSVYKVYFCENMQGSTSRMRAQALIF